jgi:diguanylate cyclase (GGDEF)-like protein
VPVRLYDGSVKAVGSALWKLRLLAGCFVLAELYAHRGLLSPSSGATGLRISFWPAIAATVGTLTVATATSLVALRVESGKLRSALGAAELVIDAVSVLAVATVLSIFGSTVTWALLIVPVLEGALRFRMRGAVLAWLALAALYPAVFLWQQPRSLGPLLLGLQTVSDRLGVVLLVAVPSGFLSDHLLTEIQALAWSQAKSTERARVLAVVAGSAAKVVSLDGNVFQAAVEGLVNMGFTTAGIVDRQGRVLFKAGDMALPVAVQAGVPSSWVGLPAGLDLSHSGVLPPSGLPDQPLPQPVVLVDASAGSEEATVLRQAGVASVVYAPLEPNDLVLVGATRLARPLPSQVEGLGLLAAQTGVAIRNRQLHEQLKEAHTRVEHQALHDPLTGLANRLSFHQELEEALSAEPNSVGLLYCDLDSFKPVNDAYGHEVGDGLLVAAAERLQGCVGRQDRVFRLGGDEFTVLLRSELAAQVAPTVAGRICLVLSQPFEVAGRVLRVSVSVGLALGSPGERADDLVNKADMAMYAAKMNGRGHWEAWRQELVAAGARAHGH